MAKIAEVRGASTLVEWLNLRGLIENVRKVELPKNIIIYQGGGGAMLLVPIVLVDALQQAIEKQFVQKTKAATITTVKSCPLNLSDLLDPAFFQEVRTALMHDLQIRKLQKETPVHFEWLPFARRCAACEIRPASEQSHMADRALLCRESICCG